MCLFLQSFWTSTKISPKRAQKEQWLFTFCKTQIKKDRFVAAPRLTNKSSLKHKDIDVEQKKKHNWKSGQKGKAGEKEFERQDEIEHQENRKKGLMKTTF